MVAAAMLLLNIGYVSSCLHVRLHVSGLHKARHVAETDQYRYIEMALGAEARPELAREAPFCWRVLVPAAARGLAAVGIDINVAFYLITNLSLFAFLITLFLFLRQLGLARRTAALGIVLTGLVQGAVRWYEYQYWMTDPACLFLVVLALALLRLEKLRPAGVVAAVAALARETSIILYTFYFVRSWRTGSVRAAVERTAMLAAIPLLLLALLRIFIRPVHADDFGAVLSDSLAFRWRHLLDNQLYVLTVGTWGVLLPLAGLYPKRLWAMARAHPEYPVLVASAYATLVVANNTERLLVYALPAVLPAALLSLDQLSEDSGLPWVTCAGFAVAAQVYVYIETRFLELGMSVYQPTNLRVVLVLAGLWLTGRLTGSIGSVRRSRARPHRSV
jgi:hypothetical protein